MIQDKKGEGVINNLPASKVCASCKEEKTVSRGKDSSFSPRRYTRGGREVLIASSWCKECERERSRTARLDPKIRKARLIKQRIYDAEHRKEHAKRSRRSEEDRRSSMNRGARERRENERIKERLPIILDVVSRYYELPDKYVLLMKGKRTNAKDDLHMSEARLTCIYLMSGTFGHFHESSAADLLGLDRSTVLTHWKRIKGRRQLKDEDAQFLWESIRSCRDDCLAILDRSRGGKDKRTRSALKKAS